MITKIPSVTVAFVLCWAVIANAQTSLREKVRDLPPAESMSLNISGTRPSMSVPDLLAVADVVVVGTIATSTSGLSEDERLVVTTYGLEVEQFVVADIPTSKQPSAALTKLTVQQDGGTAIIDGHPVHVVDNSFGLLPIGTRAVLFLKRSLSNKDVFWIVGGAYGVFNVKDSAVRIYAKTDLETTVLYDDSSLASFVEAIQRIKGGPQP